MKPMSIALRELMAERGMTVSDLWIAAGLGGPSGVYRYLSGDRGRGVNSQSAEAIRKISRALNVEPDYWMEYRAYRVREIAKKHPDLASSVYDLLVNMARAHADFDEEGSDDAE